MGKNNRFSGKLALGMFVEGNYLHVACLALKKGRIRLVDAQIMKLAKALEPVSVNEEVLSEVLNEGYEETQSMEFTEESEEMNWESEDSTADTMENTDILKKILSNFPHKNNRIALTLAEPHIYYSYFATDWMLEGKKLTQKILEELSKERHDGSIIPADALQIERLQDGRLMCVVRESEINVLNLLDYIHTSRDMKIPVLSSIESAEISLVNLINANYNFPDDEVTVVVFLGNEFSRLIFLKGNEIYNISYIIGAGLDSENINNTVYSRILLEQDNLNISNIQNILLTGEAYEAEMKEFLEGKLPIEIKIGYLKLQNLDGIGTDPIVSKYSVAIGAAWKSLLNKSYYNYNINLLPERIIEAQKKFKLGTVGLILLIILPILTFFSTVKIAQQTTRLAKLKQERQIQQEELAYLQDIETKLMAKKNQLIKFNKALAIVDSMSIGINKWHRFLQKLSYETNKIKNLWITDVVPQSGEKVLLKGFSLYRDRIPRLANAMGEGALNKVLIEEIRDRTIYQFEINALLPKDE